MKLLRSMSTVVLATAVLAATAGAASGAATPSWELTDTGVTARFRGLAPVSDRVAWVAGSAGTILRTVDGGRSWQRVDPAGAADHRHAGRAARRVRVRGQRHLPGHRGPRRPRPGLVRHRRRGAGPGVR